MRSIQADVIVTNTGNPLINGIVSFDENTGLIISVDSDPGKVPGTIEKVSGVIVPGYINAHCHLELSHLSAFIPSGTGLIDFISRVIQLRSFPQEEIQNAIIRADHEMYQNGIVAVGDISNTTDTLEVKKSSEIIYHTFVEAFDLLQPELTSQHFDTYHKVFLEFKNKSSDPVSMSPHAPYSVSEKMFKQINEINPADCPVSIHNQEHKDEDDLFRDTKGAFIDFYDSIGLSLDHFHPKHNSSLSYTLSFMRPSQHTLLVHNTMSTSADIRMAMSWSPYVFWTTCPNANLYIENQLPKYQRFLSQDVKMCIGTDSRASNWQLSIFEEMKTIKKYQSVVPDLDIVRWATINGAEALGMDHLGRIATDLRPGLNHIDVEVRDGVFDLSTALRSTRLV